jgi:hypothetical protein
VAPQTPTVNGRIVDEGGNVIEPDVEFTLPDEMRDDLTSAGSTAEQTQVAFDRDRAAALDYAAASLNTIDPLEWNSEISGLAPIAIVGVPGPFMFSDTIGQLFGETDAEDVSRTYVDGQGMLNLPATISGGGSLSGSAVGYGAGVSMNGPTYTMNNVVTELQTSSNSLKSKLDNLTSEAAAQTFADRYASTPVSYKTRNAGSTGSGTVALDRAFMASLYRLRVTSGIAAAKNRIRP